MLRPNKFVESDGIDPDFAEAPASFTIWAIRLFGHIAERELDCNVATELNSAPRNGVRHQNQITAVRDRAHGYHDQPGFEGIDLELRKRGAGQNWKNEGCE